MLIRLIIGNIIMFISSLVMVLSGFVKKKNKIIIWQTIQIGLAAVGNLVFGSLAGVIDNSIGCIRNILCYKGKLNIPIKVILVIIYTILSFLFNNMGWIGVILWIGSIFYIFLMDMKDIIKFKVLIICTMVNWMIHDLSIDSYVAFIFDIGTICSNVISIYQIKRGDNNK